MKLSEDIRKGIKLDGHQIFEALFEYDKRGILSGCCALGAARLGYNPNAAETHRRFANETTPQFKKDVYHPDEEETIWDKDLKKLPFDIQLYAVKANHLITYLNDRQKWSREQIADYLESIGH